MAHFAKVCDGIVVQVIVADPEFFDSFVDSSPGEWIQTSYNTFGNNHKLGGTPLRANFAGAGYTYNKDKDVFYAPQPYHSWVLNEESWLWEAPIPRPTEGFHNWDEPTLSWVPIEQGGV